LVNFKRGRAQQIVALAPNRGFLTTSVQLAANGDERLYFAFASFETALIIGLILWGALGDIPRLNRS
jgi:hypothetical protein